MSRYAAGTIIKRGKSVIGKPAGAENASTTGAVFVLDDAAAIYVQIDVTAVSGTTPTMTIVVEGSNDNATWLTLGTIGANGHSVGAVATAPSNITGAGTYRGVFPTTQFIRTRSVIGGTGPSFTYQVTLEPDV